MAGNQQGLWAGLRRAAAGPADAPASGGGDGADAAAAAAAAAAEEELSLPGPPAAAPLAPTPATLASLVAGAPHDLPPLATKKTSDSGGSDSAYGTPQSAATSFGSAYSGSPRSSRGSFDGAALQSQRSGGQLAPGSPSDRAPQAGPAASSGRAAGTRATGGYAVRGGSSHAGVSGITATSLLGMSAARPSATGSQRSLPPIAATQPSSRSAAAGSAAKASQGSYAARGRAAAAAKQSSTASPSKARASAGASATPMKMRSREGASSSGGAAPQHTSSNTPLASTSDIIAAAAAGAAAGAAMAAIAEAEDERRQQQQQQQQQQQLQQAPHEAARSESTGGSGTAGSTQPAVAGATSAAAAAAAPSATARRSSAGGRLDEEAVIDVGLSPQATRRSTRSSATGSSFGGSSGAGEDDVEQPGRRASAGRRSGGGASRLQAGVASLASLLGVAAWHGKKAGAHKAPARSTSSGGGSTSAVEADSPKAPSAGEAKAPAGATAATAAAAGTAKRRRLLRILLPLAALVLLVVLAIAIAVPLSKKAARHKASSGPALLEKDATAPPGGTPRGPPLTFQLNMRVPSLPSIDEPGPLCDTLFQSREQGERTAETFDAVLKGAFADVLRLPARAMSMSRLACNRQPVAAAGDAAAAAPPPTRQRGLLAVDDMAAAADPVETALVTTHLSLPAPTDPQERARLAAAIAQRSKQILTHPMSQFFGRPVEVLPAQLVGEPDLTRAIEEEGQARSSSTIRTKQLPDAEVTAGKRKQPFRQTPVPGMRPRVPAKPTPAQEQSEEVAEEVPTLPVRALPPIAPPREPVDDVWPQQPRAAGQGQKPRTRADSKGLRPPWTAWGRKAPGAETDAATNAAKDKANPSVPPTGPLAIAWPAAPSCPDKPTGSNSMPDAEGRLWGWSDAAGSCAFRTVLLRTPVYISASTAPACPGAATTANSVFDKQGRLWGWSGDRSCSFKGSLTQAPPGPGDATGVVVWQEAPSCSGLPHARNAVKDARGQLWGWDEASRTSCAFRVGGDGSSKAYEAAPRCSGSPNRFNSVRDASGRLWGWQAADQASCKFV